MCVCVWADDSFISRLYFHLDDLTFWPFHLKQTAQTHKLVSCKKYKVQHNNAVRIHGNCMTSPAFTRVSVNATEADQSEHSTEGRRSLVFIVRLMIESVQPIRDQRRLVLLPLTTCRGSSSSKCFYIPEMSLRGGEERESTGESWQEVFHLTGASRPIRDHRWVFTGSL